MPIISVETFKSTQFDYLVIGGGTAGLTVATRLSEAKNVTVGVIEAGTHNIDVPEIDIPGFIGRTIANPLYDWTFNSVPQAHLGGRSVLQPRGKGLGGSSANNFLGMFRPAKEELDALEGLGNKGWNWSSLLHYMKKSETAFPSNLSASDEIIFAAKPEPQFHGTSGPIKKSFPTYWTATQPLLFDAAEALGVPRNPEMGNGSNVGSMSSFHSIDPHTATRSYATSAYYAPNSTRPNLLVLVNAQVTKIILQKSENRAQRATGVELVIDGLKHSIRGVKRDLILSTGTFQTPQLLELSGIGNPSILRKHGVEPVINLPGVGENLQDHICVRSILEIDQSYETLDVLSIPEELEKHLSLYKEKKEGILSSCPAQGFVFLSSQHLGSPDNVKSLQEKIKKETDEHLRSVAAPSIKSGLKKQYELLKGWFQKDDLAQAEILNIIGHQPLPTPLPVPGKRYTTLVSALMHPLSRGTVHIGSSDPLSPPLIDPNYFSITADLELLVDILAFTITKLAKTAPFSDIMRSFVLPWPDVMLGSDSTEEGFRDRLRGYIKETAGPVYHPVGTAAMLPLSDGGVVDSELKVYGTENLRVVDVSILPLEMSTHIQSLAYGIGEKAADILVSSWQLHDH